MAIQPIDLQTVYAQMDKLVQTVSHMQNGEKLTQAMQQERIVRENAEKAASVQKTQPNDSDIRLSKDDRRKHGNGQGENFSNKESKQTEEENLKNEKTSSIIQESYLGNHIDITG